MYELGLTVHHHELILEPGDAHNRESEPSYVRGR